ncbi:hypothetical protein [Hyphomicrobium sp. DY-1]|uniref:hypothetical protein n=1 Tax=Hyphomicrobium sp. DY-1 TaxID=3075650 RepID=UPI0039C1D1C9
MATKIEYIWCSPYISESLLFDAQTPKNAPRYSMPGSYTSFCTFGANSTAAMLAIGDEFDRIENEKLKFTFVYSVAWFDPQNLP